MEQTHHTLLAQVASMYYEQEMTQSAIGQALGLSRVKVYRLLKEARTEDVVQITINWPGMRDRELEKTVRERFDLQEVLALNSQTGPTNLSQLGRLGASYLERSLTDGSTMAVCLGRSTYETINALSPDFQAQVRVAQAVGSMPFAMQELDSATLARALARKLGGEVLYLTSPLMGDTIEASRVIRQQRDIRHTLQAARAADVALTGIGNLDPAISGFRKSGFISAAALTELRANGAAGDMAGQIYTLEGELYPCEYNQRIIGITLDDLKRIPICISVAMGRNKAGAILGGLRTGAINVLCADDETLRRVLELADQSPREENQL